MARAGSSYSAAGCRQDAGAGCAAGPAPPNPRLACHGVGWLASSSGQEHGEENGKEGRAQAAPRPARAGGTGVH